MKLLFSSIALALSLVIASCSSHDIEEKLQNMMEHPIELHLEDMICWNPINIDVTDSISEKSNTFIVYVDSTQCSPCYISRLPEWAEFLELEQSEECNTTFQFIFDPRDGMLDELREKLVQSGFKHPVYIDSTHVFGKDNVNIPSDPLYHSFLMNNKNEIILVGNPCTNLQIKDLLLKQIKN